MSSIEAQAATLIAQGRAYVMKRAPYVVRALYSLAIVPTKEVNVMGVTKGLVLYYNPHTLVNDPEFNTEDKNGLPNGYEVVGGCLYHEVWHILRGMWRLDALPNHKLANLAADISINYDLTRAGWRLPSYACSHDAFGIPPGLTLEQNYAYLEKKQPLSITICAGQCGGIAGNAANPQLEAELDAKYGRHDAEKKQIRAATQADINKHIQKHGAGSTPGFIEEKVTVEKREFPINWMREVSHVVQYAGGRIEAGGTDFSYSRPSKRAALLGTVRPGTVDQLPDFVFIRDTSASMNQEQLNSANSVIVSVMKKMGVDEVWLVDADTEVQREPTRIQLKMLPQLTAKGRGGTSFIKPLEAVCKIRPKPNVCIYLTDGDGEAPPSPPRGIPVIWCIVPTPYGRKPANWGRIVVCSNDQELREVYS